MNYELPSYIYSSLKINPLKYHLLKTKLSNPKRKTSSLAEKNPPFLETVVKKNTTKTSSFKPCYEFTSLCKKQHLLHSDLYLALTTFLDHSLVGYQALKLEVCELLRSSKMQVRYNASQLTPICVSNKGLTVQISSELGISMLPHRCQVHWNIQIYAFMPVLCCWQSSI